MKATTQIILTCLMRLRSILKFIVLGAQKCSASVQECNHENNSLFNRLFKLDLFQKQLL